jgi:hypothetical protein
MADDRASGGAKPEHTTTRRELLGTLGAASAMGMISQAAEGARPRGGPADRGGIVTEADRREYARLKALNLSDAKVAALAGQMPAGKIDELQVGRLICGSNLISMNMHSRDLSYVRALATHYNTEDRVFMTLKRCEELGVNTIVLKNHNFKRFRLSRYWDEWGGKMKWIADVITTDINQYERLLVEHLELGASAAYLWGGASDIWYFQNKQRNIVKAMEIMRKHGMPAGICAHKLEPIQFAEKEGLAPDFYMKTLHHDRYWSAHPTRGRQPLEMYRKPSPDHDKYHDNLFCQDFKETVAFMQTVKAPWIAFKVLAAGAIPATDGFEKAFEGGADFVCVGMFDFQVAEDVKLTRQAVAKAGKRKRPWA